MARSTRWVATLVLSGIISALGGPLTAQTASHLASVGDQVDVEFFTASGAEVREITGSRWIDQNGQIYLAYIGLTTVVGRDSSGIREHLIEQFAAFYDSPVIEVVVKLRVNVTGSVGQPGHYFLEPTSTLIDALSVAGGPGSELDFGSAGGSSDQSQVHLVRQGQLEVLDLRAQTMVPTTFDRLVESGDWLYVPPRPRSRWRDNIQFVGSIVTLIASGFFIYDVAKN
jgi:protein involved in polysaccharide export with SLBB domain